VALYTTTAYPLIALIEDINPGKIGLPEIQSPFVWPNVNVRNLFDFLYRGYPTAEEVRAALQEILSERPHKTIDLDSLSANLAGRPMSDVAWVVNDAARAAAREKKDAIDQADLMAAADRLGALAGNNSNGPG
jgi:hypothetical protein